MFAASWRMVVLPPFCSYTPYSVTFTLSSFQAGQTSLNSFMQYKDRVQSSCLVISHLFLPVALEVSVTRCDAEGWPAAGSESSWRSRSWSSTRYCRAGPARSGRSWRGVAGPRTLCSGPRDSQLLQPSKR